MRFHLTDELRVALRENPGQPLELRDEDSQKDYLLIDAEAAPRLMCNWLIEAIDEGVRAADEGRVSTWDTEQTKRRGREWLAQRQQNQVKTR